MASETYRTVTKNRSQSAKATGTAQTSARAKLRCGPRLPLSASGSIRGGVSSMIAALNITPKGLPPLGSARQRRPADFHLPSRVGRSAGIWGGTTVALVGRMWDEITAAGFVLRLVMSDDNQQRDRGRHVICLDGTRAPGQRRLVLPRLVLMAACVLAPRLAYAQAVEPKVETPIDLFLPENSPGVRIAPSLILKPGLDATVLFDTNVYNQTVNARSDTLAIVRPSFQLATDWSRHLVKLSGMAEARRYFRIGSENSEQWQLDGQASLDLANRTKFDLSAAIARRIELRGTAGDAFNTDRPVRLLEKRVAAQIARTGGKLELIGGASVSRFDYDSASLNGVPLDLSSRDVTMRQAHVRANYRLGPKLGLFADVSGNQVDYSLNPGPSRNSSGFGVLVGLHYQISALLDAEIAAGYLRQSFRDPLLRPVSGFNYAVTMNWTPTPRWKITGAGHRSIDPGPLANVPAIVRSDFELKAQRAMSDKVLVELSSGYLRENYRGTLRNDSRYFGQLAVSYRVSDRLLATALAGYRKQDSSVSGRSYDGFSAGVTASFRL